MSPSKSWSFVKDVTSHKQKCEILQVYLILQLLHLNSQQFEKHYFPLKVTWSETRTDQRKERGLLW